MKPAKNFYPTILVAGLCSAALLFGSTNATNATPITLTFDDISIPSVDPSINVPNGYGTLQWNNFAVISAYNYPGTGYYNGMVTRNNDVFDANGLSASFSRSTPFDLDSAYLTAAFKTGMFQTSMQVEVQGYNGSSLVYDNTYTLMFDSTTTMGPAAPTLINFDYTGVTEVNFIPSSGQFVMDNLTVTIPETAPTLILLGISVLGLRMASGTFKKRLAA